MENIKKMSLRKIIDYKMTDGQLTAWIILVLLSGALTYYPEIIAYWGWWPLVMISIFSLIDGFVLYKIWWKKLPEKIKHSATHKKEPIKEIKVSGYNGWLVSDNFIKRAAAVWGYNTIFNVFLSLLIVAMYWGVKSYI